VKSGRQEELTITRTSREQAYCEEIVDRVNRMRALLAGRTLDSTSAPAMLYEFLAALKQIQGNASNDISFVATLLAKDYLEEQHGVFFCAAQKPQSAPGMDIDVTATDGRRVVGEIKTTVPYQRVDFGAQQAAMFKKDFAKLIATQAEHKYLFVTERATFEVLKKPKYLKLMPGVRVVLLPNGDAYNA
jgi:hypothetical protein